MVSERKAIIRDLKKEMNSLYLELGEFSLIEEDVNLKFHLIFKKKKKKRKEKY